MPHLAWQGIGGLGDLAPAPVADGEAPSGHQAIGSHGFPWPGNSAAKHARKHGEYWRWAIQSSWWFGTWLLCFHIMGISSSQLTFVFFRGVGIPPTRIYGKWSLSLGYLYFITILMAYIYSKQWVHDQTMTPCKYEYIYIYIYLYMDTNHMGYRIKPK